MKYFFVLGNNPALSLAELKEVFETDDLIYLNKENICLLESDKTINPDELIRRLGGTIKFGSVENQLANVDELKNKIIKLLHPKEGKFKFGISIYSDIKIDKAKLAMHIKDHLKNNGTSSRWVTSRENTLSSVVVEQNKLITQGIEIIIIKTAQQIILCQTLAVQAFKELSFRDFGRPARDDHSGMIPPKLAQIMLNLSGAKKEFLVFDPFCGSGTIIMEAMLMGFTNILGADASPRAIDDTKTNSDWIKEKFTITNVKLKLLQENVKSISRRVEKNSVDAIITEPYLGPQRGRIDTDKTILDLNALYSRAITEFARVSKISARIVMIWPVYTKSNERKFLNPKITGFKFIDIVPESLRQQLDKHLSPRNTIIYGRPGQKVWREIVVLEK